MTDTTTVTSAYSLLLEHRATFTQYAANHTAKIGRYEEAIASLDETENSAQIAELRELIEDTREKARVNTEYADKITDFLNQEVDAGFAGHLIGRIGDSLTYSPADQLTAADREAGWFAKRIYYGTPVFTDEEHIKIRSEVIQLLNPTAAGGFVPPLSSNIRDLLVRVLDHLRDRRPELSENNE